MKKKLLLLTILSIAQSSMLMLAGDRQLTTLDAEKVQYVYVALRDATLQATPGTLLMPNRLVLHQRGGSFNLQSPDHSPRRLSRVGSFGSDGNPGTPPDEGDEDNEDKRCCLTRLCCHIFRCKCCKRYDAVPLLDEAVRKSALETPDAPKKTLVRRISASIGSTDSSENSSPEIVPTNPHIFAHLRALENPSSGEAVS